MKKKIALMLAAVVAAVFLVAACAPPGPEPTASTAQETAVPEPTPEPTAAGPVTRQDLPAYFMPGLNEIGAVPEEAYHIGIVACDACEDQAWWQELQTICGEYQQRFGLDISCRLCTDAQAQLAAVQEMVGAGIDFLILSPVPGDAMAPVAALCEEQGVPFITMNESIAATPGQGEYVCTIQRDDYMIGVLSGISIIRAMTEKYGQPKGNIGEIIGTVDDTAGIFRSMGLRCALAPYPDIRVVCSVAGDYDADISYAAAVNLLKAFRTDELDGIVVADDATGLQALQAVLDYDRSELKGCIWSAGATLEGLTCVYYGDFAQTVECTCQTGMVALEYALSNLAGQGDIPPVICAMTRVFTGETAQKKDAIAQVIAAMNSMDTRFCLDDMGDYGLFAPDEKQLAQTYPRHYYEYDDVQAFLDTFEPYTTGEPLYPDAG